VHQLEEPAASCDTGKWNIVVAYESIGTAQPSQPSLKIVEITLRQSFIGDQCAEHPEDLGLRYALELGRLDDESPTDLTPFLVPFRSRVRG
jgi:hypothetical protein